MLFLPRCHGHLIICAYDAIDDAMLFFFFMLLLGALLMRSIDRARAPRGAHADA